MDTIERERQLKIYELKTDLLHLLQDFKKDLKNIIETKFSRSDVSPELTEFFKEKEYIELNMFLSKYISLLEKPAVSMDSTESTFLKEKDFLLRIIDEILNRLNYTVHKLEKFGERGRWILEQLTFDEYMMQVKNDLEQNLEKAINRTLNKDIAKLKSKLKGVDNIENYQDLINFKNQLEGEINFYISHEIFPKIEHIFNSYKRDLAKKIDQYVQKLSIDQDLKDKINEDLSEMVDSFNIKPSEFYYISPDFSPNIFNYNKNFSEFEILKENITSTRFLILITVGLILVFSGFFIPDRTFEIIVISLGIVTVIYSIIDSMFFNDYFYYKYIEMIKNKIKNDLSKSIDEIKNSIKERLIKIAERYERNISSVIKNETVDIRNFLEDIEDIERLYTKYIEKISEKRESIEGV
ncbi:hypothetical protein [Persephonella sp.]